jgi:hypothetical protein
MYHGRTSGTDNQQNIIPNRIKRKILECNGNEFGTEIELQRNDEIQMELNNNGIAINIEPTRDDVIEMAGPQ